MNSLVIHAELTLAYHGDEFDEIIGEVADEGGSVAFAIAALIEAHMEATARDPAVARVSYYDTVRPGTPTVPA